MTQPITKRVRIVKARLSSYWYADFIGQEFTITLGSKSCLWEAEMPNRNNDIGYIDLEDCEVIEAPPIPNSPTDDTGRIGFTHLHPDRDSRTGLKIEPDDEPEPQYTDDQYYAAAQRIHAEPSNNLWILVMI